MGKLLLLAISFISLYTKHFLCYLLSIIVVRRFFHIYHQIIAKRKSLVQQLETITATLKTLPEGSLICAQNGKHSKWYHSTNHTPVYLSKKERPLAEKLAQKKYLSLLSDDLQHEIDALDAYLQVYRSHPQHTASQLFTNPEYTNLLASSYQSPSQEYLAWANATYERNPKHPEQLIHHSLSGNSVRSKSEALIDMTLSMNHIPFRYECALPLGNTTFYPDFTIKHPRTGNLFYWEHFGLMDVPSYHKNVFDKLEIYASHQIIPGIQLITTYETKECPLTSDTVNRIVHEYFN